MDTNEHLRCILITVDLKTILVSITNHTCVKFNFFNFPINFVYMLYMTPQNLTHNYSYGSLYRKINK